MKKTTTILFDSINVNEATKITTIKTEGGIIIRATNNMISRINYDIDETNKKLNSGSCDIPTWIAVQRGLVE